MNDMSPLRLFKFQGTLECLESGYQMRLILDCKPNPSSRSKLIDCVPNQASDLFVRNRKMTRMEWI